MPIQRNKKLISNYNKNEKLVISKGNLNYYPTLFTKEYESKQYCNSRCQYWSKCSIKLCYIRSFDKSSCSLSPGLNYKGVTTSDTIKQYKGPIYIATAGKDPIAESMILKRYVMR